MKKHNDFLIDLSAKRVLCRVCRKSCKSLELADFTLFWCSTKSCRNDEEVRLYSGNKWRVFAVKETLQENSISEITRRLVRTIGARERRKA